jgi:hypothetical protein
LEKPHFGKPNRGGEKDGGWLIGANNEDGKKCLDRFTGQYIILFNLFSSLSLLFLKFCKYCYLKNLILKNSK